MLENTFTVMLNMSITASVAAIFIVFFRWIFGNRLPKIFSYSLWAIVLLRLIIPFSISSMFSIFNAIHVPEAIITQSQQYHAAGNNLPNRTDYEAQDTAVGDVLGNNINSSMPAATPEASVDPVQVFIFFTSWTWITGAIILFSLSIFSYFRASRKLKDAVLYKHSGLISHCNKKLKLNRDVQIYTSDRIHTPVVCGLINPRIILPLFLTQNCSDLELKHVITHELVHIKRYDYILKPLSMLALCIHWFNPVIWVSFKISQKDMEMSCDEAVMSVFDNDIRSEYATSLIKLVSKQNVLLNGGLLAFGESNIKSRIKGIMNFRKPRTWIGSIAIATLIAISLLLLTNGQSEVVKEVDTNEYTINSEQITGFAWDIIKKDIANYESNPEVKIKDSKLTRLELIESFDALADTPIDVYALEYRILPEDLTKVVMAGGMDIDEDGWLKETCSMGSPLLVISRKVGSAELIGILWSGGVLEEGGVLESSVKNLLKQNIINIDADNSTSSDNTIPQMSEVDFNKKLIDNLDKETDETIKYVYRLSPQNIKIGNIYSGNFTQRNSDELLVVFKLKSVPHAGGLDCSIVGIYDKKTLNIITQKTFPFDECQFDILNDNAGKGLLIFSGSSTYQGSSSFILQIYRPGKDWKQVLPQENGIYSNNDQYKFIILNNGIISANVPTIKTDGSGDSPEWKTKYFLKWDPVTQNLVDFVPSNYDFYKNHNLADVISISPNGRYGVISHEWGFDGNSYILLYDIKQNKLMNKYNLLAQHFGFTWSPDSKKICISRLARIWVGVSVLNVETGKLIEDINTYELFKGQGVSFNYELDQNRPDPAYTPLEWSPESNRILMFYQWTDTNGMRQNGTFLYDINNQTVSDIIQNKPYSEGGNIESKKPDGFAW